MKCLKSRSQNNVLYPKDLYGKRFNDSAAKFINLLNSLFSKDNNREVVDLQRRTSDYFHLVKQILFKPPESEDKKKKAATKR